MDLPAQLTRNKLKIRGQPRILSQEEKKLDRKDRLKPLSSKQIQF